MSLPIPNPPGRRTRRTLLIQAGAAALAGTLGTRAEAQAAAADLPAAGAAFGAETVPAIARARAARPYIAPRDDDLPDALAGLNRDQYAAIATAPGSAIWAEAGLGVTIEPLHRGSVYGARVALALVEDGLVRPVAYDPARFTGPALPAFATDPGYSGFRLRARVDGPAPADFAVFQGASFFRLVAAGQGFGVTARALTLRPADPRGEEFPQWRAFWIERPAPGAPLVLHALVESESAVAAFRMSLRPGAASLADVEGTVFARAAIDHLGLAGMTSRYLFGPYDRRGADDARPAVHASGGLQIRTGADEAIWRPARNPETLQVSAFLDADPKRFGLMQRARDYAAFQDDVQHWEWRPSLLVEPLGRWGEGAVSLLEIPSDSEQNENVLAYWRPKAGLAAGAEMSFAYRQAWCWEAPEPVGLATVSGTRSGRGTTDQRRLFLVDFTGPDLSSGEEVVTALSASPGTIASRSLFRYPERKTVRVAFELDPGPERVCELRLALRRGGRPLTETWLYRWTP